MISIKQNLKLNSYKSTHHAETARKESFKEILSTLSGRRYDVFKAILHYYPVSNDEIAEILGIKVQSVTGRVHELRGNIWDFDLKRTVLDESKVFVEFDSYIDKEHKGKGVRWRPTDKALIIEPELFQW